MGIKKVKQDRYPLVGEGGETKNQIEFGTLLYWLQNGIGKSSSLHTFFTTQSIETGFQSPLPW